MTSNKPIDPSIVCEQCGASMRFGVKHCLYCDTPFDLDLKALKTRTRNKPNDIKCPDCAIVMETFEVEQGDGIAIERCVKCLGIFLHVHDLYKVLKEFYTKPGRYSSIKIAELTNCPEKPRELKVVYRGCPVCERGMLRVQPGHKTGVVIDYCKSHGTWLDHGELRHLIRWTKAGGRDDQTTCREMLSLRIENEQLVKQELERLWKKGKGIQWKGKWDKSGHDSFFKVVLDSIKMFFGGS